MTDRPVRVLMIINSLGPGGAERSTVEMIPALGERGVQVEIVCLNDRRDGIGDLPQAGITVHSTVGGSAIGTVRGLRSLILGSVPDVVHTTLFEADIMGRLAAMGTDVPVLSSLVNMSYQPVRLLDPKVKPLKLTAVRLIDGFTARHMTTWFHALTHAVAGEATRALGIEPERITVVPRGRDPIRWRPGNTEDRVRIRHQLGVEEPAQVILAVGRQEFQKDHPRLVEAMTTVRARFPTATLLIAGREGNASGQIIDAIERTGGDENVRLLGHQSDVRGLMVAADVLAFPSLYEGLGGTVVEALATGLPVVCSDLPPLREVVGPGGAVFVPSGSAEALGEAINSILGDPVERRRLSTGGRTRFLEEFTLERVADRMSDLYRRVAAGPL